MEFETKAIHYAQDPDRKTGAIINPISLSTTFYQDGVGKHYGYEYSRTQNPTREVLEKAVAALENGKFGLAFSSGCAATMAVLSILKSGDKIVASSDIYGGTFRIFEKILRPMGIETSYVFSDNADDFKGLIDDKTRMVWIETPSNPLLKIFDIKEISNYKKDIILVVDNTFASPYFQKPLDFGANVVIHSSSKYINGHSDVIGGLVVTNDVELYNLFKFYQNAAGAVPSPFDCYLTLRGIKTLAIRMERHQQNAIKIVNYLKNNPLVKKVYYPGIESSHNYRIALSQMTGFGGMISFEINFEPDSLDIFFRSLKFIKLAESLGGVESLICLPSKMTHASMSKEEREKRGIKDELIRLSVGIENVNDLISDLENAFKSTQRGFISYEI